MLVPQIGMFVKTTGGRTGVVVAVDQCFNDITGYCDIWFGDLTGLDGWGRRILLEKQEPFIERILPNDSWEEVQSSTGI